MQQFRSIIIVAALMQSLFMLVGCSENTPLLTIEEAGPPSSQVLLQSSSQKSGTVLDSTQRDSIQHNDSLGNALSSSQSMGTSSSSEMLIHVPVEIEFIGTEGIVAIDLTQKRVLYSEPTEGYDIPLASDGNIQTYWSSDNYKTDPWYQVDLEGFYRITSIAVTARQDEPRPLYRDNLAVWVSNDPTFFTYIEIGRVEGNADVVYPEFGVWTLSVTAQESYRYVRIQRINDAGHFNVAELSVTGEQTGALLMVKAGAHQKVRDTNNSGSEKISIHASMTNGRYQIEEIEWTLDGNSIGSDSLLSYMAPVGVHTFIVSVTDAAGDQVRDSVVVEVTKGFEFDPNAAFVEISNWDMAKRMGRGINMGNTLEARNGEGSWAPAAEEYYFDDYKEAGFTNVRIPIHWGTRINDEGIVDSDFMNRIEEIVDWSLSRGLVTIINTHHEEWIIEDYTGNKGKLLKIWEQIGERFQGKSENLVFEVFNEPRDPMGPGDVTDLNHAVVAEIRKTNPKRICIITGDNWGYFNDLKTVTWPDDPYIIASLHYYHPSSFTHEKDRTWDDTGTMWQNLDGILEWLHEERGVPGFVGEFGVNHGQYDKEWESVFRFYNTTTDAFSKWETPYSVWDDHGWYKIYDRRNRTFNDIVGALQWEH
ncbi:MAG: cellulase family glycosylhydrolase [Fibrobacterales bacterium]